MVDFLPLLPEKTDFDCVMENLVLNYLLENEARAACRCCACGDKQPCLCKNVL